MKKIGRAFVRGLMIVVPVTVTVYVVLWLWTGARSGLDPMIHRWIPERLRYPGLGLAAAVLLILLLGAMWNLRIFRRMFRLLESLFDHLPLVKTLYGAVRDLLGLFQQSEGAGLNQVVMVKLGDTGAKVLGFVTREDFSDLPAGIGSKEQVAVYISMSYNIGGFTITVPRSSVEPVNMPVEDAMRYAITAGVPPKRLETMVRRKK